MFAALVIVFREVFEAGLVIGILAAALGHAPRALSYICAGVLAGVAGSMVIALFAGQIADFFGGYGQELLNASILMLAVAMLAWHTLWMARQGRQIAQELKQLGQDAARGAKPMLAVAVVVATSVLREGAEVVLFLYGTIASSGATGLQSLAGGLAGIILGGLVSYVTYKGIVRIPMRWIFTATTGLIALLAAGMAAQAARFLQAAGVTETMTGEVWDWSLVLPDKSLTGTFLKALVGYSDRPTQLMLLAFSVTLVLFIFASYAAKPRPGKVAATPR